MKCYAYDNKFSICSIYGCDCDFEYKQKEGSVIRVYPKWCFHTSKKEAMEKNDIIYSKINNDKDVIKNTDHDTKKKQLLDLIEELKGKGVSANVSAQVAVSFMAIAEQKESK